MTKDNKNLIEISLNGTLRIIVSDEIMKEIQVKSISQEIINLNGINMIIEPATYDMEPVPSGKMLTYFNAAVVTL